MKQHRTLLAMLSTVLLAACQVFAQETGELVAAEVPPATQSGSFFSVVFSGGLLGVLTWAAIFFWAIALLPLGVLSIVHCSSLRSKRWPLTTKLLLFGPVFQLVLGWIGVVQSLIGMFASLGSGAPDAALFALNASQSFYSLAGTLFLMQFYLLFFLISFVIIHFKHKQMDKDS
jgi:hypothetical protein